MSVQTKKWVRLDNAAKIYPAAKSRNWMALFRLSALLYEPVDSEILRAALDRMTGRFPLMFQRLRRGFFWNYMEQNEGAPPVEPDVSNPCGPVDLRRNREFMFRVRYHHRRISVEFYHVLTDGTGGLCFLKTLVAEYLELKHGVKIPREGDILDCSDEPTKEEKEDSFLRNAREISRSRGETEGYYIRGTGIKNNVYITTGIMKVSELKALAKKYDATITELLTGVLILAVDKVQRAYVLNVKKLKPVKVCVPINLRKYYGSKTLRNFSSYTNPGIMPSYGNYSLDETIALVKGHMILESNEKYLNAKFTANVMAERNYALRLMPLFIKLFALKLVFKRTGDRQSSTSLSNLGNAAMPAEMEERIERLDFMLGPLSRNRVAAACIGCKGDMIVNFSRTIQESYIERKFFTTLVKLGIKVKIESNRRS